MGVHAHVGVDAGVRLKLSDSIVVKTSATNARGHIDCLKMLNGFRHEMEAGGC